MWPFDQPPNCATLTSTYVMRDRKPVTHAYHDDADHGWQFYSDDKTESATAMVVCLKEIVELDRTILEIADLPPGWMATRPAIGEAWIRTIQYADAPRIVVDWSNIQCIDDFYESVFQQSKAPSWHGRNLNALADSWVGGDVNEHGPPYCFEFDSTTCVRDELVDFMNAVMAIAMESVEENGGRYQVLDEHADAGEDTAHSASDSNISPPSP